MSVEGRGALQGVDIPKLDGLIPTSGHDLGIVELETIDAILVAQQVMRARLPTQPALFELISLFVQVVPVIDRTRRLLPVLPTLIQPFAPPHIPVPRQAVVSPADGGDGHNGVHGQGFHDLKCQFAR